MMSPEEFDDLIISKIKSQSSPDKTSAENLREVFTAIKPLLYGANNFKIAVKTASTSSTTLSGEQTRDGVPLVTGDRHLEKDNSDPKLNGIWIVGTGAWVRASDADSTEDLQAAVVVVGPDGTQNKNKIFQQVTNQVEIGVSDIVWTEFSAGGSGDIIDNDP